MSTLRDALTGRATLRDLLSGPVAGLVITVYPVLTGSGTEPDGRASCLPQVPFSVISNSKEE